MGCAQSSRQRKQTSNTEARDDPRAEDELPVQRHGSGSETREMIFAGPTATTRNFYKMSESGTETSGAGPKIDLGFPMYVISTSQLRRLQKLVPHEVALASGMVEILDPTVTKLVVFWSHEWLGRDHPDPDNVQLDCVHGFLSGVASGPMGLRRLLEKSQGTVTGSNLFQGLGMMESEFVESVCNGSHWIDYLCVPQDTSAGDGKQAAAISSIAGYASQADLMIVLCPPAVHTSSRPCDLGSWRKRGWCRLELLSMQWTHDNFPVMIITAPDELRIGADLMAKKMTEADAPCNGRFSCCEFNHVIKGEPMKCDKYRVYQCLECLHDVRVRGVLKVYGVTLQWRWAKAMRSIVLSGLYEDASTGSDRPSRSARTLLPKFLADYELKADELDEVQNTPLHWAAFLGNCEAACELLESDDGLQLMNNSNRSEMHQDIRLYSLLAGGGATPMILAAERGFCGVVMALTDANADVNAKTIYGATALNMASTRGHAEIVEFLLEGGAQVDLPLNKQSRFFGHCVGFTPLHSAAIEGHEKVVQLLLASGSNASLPSLYGATPLHCSVAFKERPGVVFRLIVAKADLQAQCYSDYPVASWQSATARDVAEGKGFTEVLQLLTDAADDILFL